MGILIDNIKDDKKVIFDDFEQITGTLADSTEIEILALPSFIGILNNTDGIEIGTDNAEIQIDYDDFLEKYPGKTINKNDIITFSNQIGSSINFKIETIARDRTLGIWSCQLHVLSVNETAGIIDRAGPGAI